MRFDGSGLAGGDDFAIVSGEAYFVHAGAPVPFFNPNDLGDPPRCPAAAFAPLGGEAICETVRAATPCPDPIWLLTSGGRAAVGADLLDDVQGRVTIAYGTSGTPDPSESAGVLALLDVTGVSEGETTLQIERAILGNDAEPPRAFAVRASDATVRVPEADALVCMLAALLALGARGSGSARKRVRSAEAWSKLHSCVRRRRGCGGRCCW